jgi:hypothetical protein
MSAVPYGQILSTTEVFLARFCSLVIRFNGDRTLISWKNSFWVLSYPVEQDIGKGWLMESKFHCRKNKGKGKKYLFVFWRK